MNYGKINKTDTANGPGVRVSLFVSGCRHHCKGCFNPETWNFNYGNPFDEAVINDVLNACAPSYKEGLSLLGGDPFEPENREGLIELCRRFNELYPDKTIWCYTGFTFEELLSDTITNPETARALLNELHVLVDGRFVEELKNLALKFRGSSNQRILDVKKSLAQGTAVIMEGEWERKVGSMSIYDI